MKHRQFLFSALCIALVCTPIGGCGQSQADADEALKFFGMTYYNYHEIWRKPAASWDDVLTLAEGPGLEDDRALLAQARESGYSVVWGTDPKAPDASSIVLAYHPDAVAKGGKVLFVDGSLRNMTGSELKTQLETLGEQTVPSLEE